MNETDDDRLRSIGFTTAIAQAYAALDAHEGKPLRVVEVHRETVHLHDGAAEHGARILPRLARALAAAEVQLAVGDWVLARRDDFGAFWVHARVAPVTQLLRRSPAGERLTIVANVDTALLLMGADGDFNPRRIERYLALVKPAGIWPVVVVTKIDLVPAQDLEPMLDTLRMRLPADVAVHALDARAAAANVELAPYLAAGQTLVLLGSSGAGKSTLANTLLGAAAQATGPVRADGSRGRHTTTTRSLHRLPGGACLIDTPGLRGLRPEGDESQLAASFGDIEALAAQCRYRDCRHQNEPGCAVRAAVEPDRLNNYQKLRREMRRDQMTLLERRRQLSEWKARTRAVRAWLKVKR